MMISSFDLIRFLICMITLLVNAKPKEPLILEDFGAIPLSRNKRIIKQNTKIFSKVLSRLSYDVLIINSTYYFEHGIIGSNISNSVIQIDGEINFVRNYWENPFNDNLDDWHFRLKPCLYIANSTNVTFTSSSDQYYPTSLSKLRFGHHHYRHHNSRGVINGGGPQWWGVPGISYLRLGEHRPVLFQVNHTKNLLVENLIFMDSPFWTMNIVDINGLVIRHTSIVNRRTESSRHGAIDLSAFNTDGIDIAGHNVHVHDVDIWNQDDCIAVKDNHAGDGVSSNMTFERIHASGLGLVIGSIGATTVRNITFRDSYLYKTFKGIYMKFRFEDNAMYMNRDGGLIENILFENITMDSPMSWPIWVGPAQQTGGSSGDLCHASPCSLCWPRIPGATCSVVKASQYRNITLRDVNISNPRLSPGIIKGGNDVVKIGNDEIKNTINGIVFDSVVVRQSPSVKRRIKGDLDQMYPGLDAGVDDPLMKEASIIIILATVALVVLLSVFVVQYVRDSESREARTTTEGSTLLQRLLPNSAQTFDVDNDNEDESNERSTRRDDQNAITKKFWVCDAALSLFLYLRKSESQVTSTTTEISTTFQRVPSDSVQTLDVDETSEGESNERNTQLDSRNITRSKQFWFCHISLSLFLVSIIVFFCWLLFAPKKVRNVNTYFACDGVVNGIAIGDTWPIPSCFVDKTNPNKATDSFGRTPSPSNKIIIMLLIAVTALSLQMKRLLFAMRSHNGFEDNSENNATVDFTGRVTTSRQEVVGSEEEEHDGPGLTGNLLVSSD